MTVYHFRIPATDATDATDFYFLRKAEAVTACKAAVVRMVDDDRALSGYVVEIKRSDLAKLPKEELLLRIMNQRGFLRNTVVLEKVQAPTMEAT